MTKIKLEIEIELQNVQELIDDYKVENINELEIVMRSEAKQDIGDFLAWWSCPVICKNLKLEL